MNGLKEENKAWWWDFVLIPRNICFILIYVIMHVIGFQQKFIVISLITYLVVFITANIHMKPYQEKMLNVLDSVGLLALVCFLTNELVALLREPEIYEDDHKPDSYFFEISLVLLPSLIYFFILA